MALLRSSILDSASIAFFSLSSLILLVSSYFFSASPIFFSSEPTKAYQKQAAQEIVGSIT